MRNRSSAARGVARYIFGVFLLLSTPLVAAAVYGPWNAEMLQGGVGFDKALPKQAKILAAHVDWSLYGWVHAASNPASRMLLAGVGNPNGPGRYFFTKNHRLGFWWGNGPTILSEHEILAGQWHFIAAVKRGGQLSLYLDGQRIATGAARQVAVAPRLILGPHNQPWATAAHFGGKIAEFAVQDGALNQQRLATLAKHKPDSLTRFAAASKHWPVQTHQMPGLRTIQPPATLPHSNAPFSEPHKKPVGKRAGLKSTGKGLWTLDDWRIASANALSDAGGSTISKLKYTTGQAWYRATVPGTVLTTLVNRGVYPNPDYGLNNMAIPESLHEHDWWYRTTFKVPKKLSGKHLQLTFNGINYRAQVWINGKHIGYIEGAFIRGKFDVSNALRPGQRNVIAVRLSPPPHPGIAQEQSLAAGPGPNGGVEALDGPTFIATEGWDWIPAVRDRDTGLWQDVTLRASAAVRIGDTRVITTFPHTDHSRADVEVDVPLNNLSAAPVRGQLHIAFGNVRVAKSIKVAPGRTTVKLTPAQFSELTVHHPHLWWPNGYGKQNLYHLKASFTTHGMVSSRRHLQFGIREISYELSLFDSKGRLRRVLINLNKNRARGKRIIDVSHKGIRKTPHGWAESLLPGAEHSPAVKYLKDKRLTPYLAIRVNGVRIAMKGGSWGTDDWRKRISKKRLEPYFKLEHNAHMTVIRNWVGQSTEPVFYKLADKYGLLVLNDFWQSTQNYNMEPQDDALFLRNAADTVRRYRNHPSIAMWFGRNEGVPQPLLNKRLDKMIARLDGTRWYTGSSNDINLQQSGPYSYQQPQAYFTTLGKGFAVEIGTPSFPTLEAFKADIPKADRWPISDDWAYHDWHQSGNGDVSSFMKSMRTKFGKPTSLTDFARKAQMMNYVSYRAIFEGFNAHLWSQNSGRLLWMTHPAWLSTTWQIYSHDDDTHASYYGAKKAAEPVHVQMNLPNRHIAVINNTARALHGLKIKTQVYALDGKQLAQNELRIDAGATSVTPVTTKLDLNQMAAKQQVIFVALQLHAQDGHLLSRNFYWSAAQPKNLQKLDMLPVVQLHAKLRHTAKHQLKVHVYNPSAHVVLSTKLTLVDAADQRILPAYYSDNYLNLAPHESRDITISAQSSYNLSDARVKMRGWNVETQVLNVSADDGTTRNSR